MASFRDIKDMARRDLHQAMQVPAFYFAPGAVLPLPVNIRVHNKWLAKGDAAGTSFHFAEVREDTPELIFLAEECDPQNGAAVTISPIEGYRVTVPDPRYLRTIMAKCVPLQPRELRDLPTPEGGRYVVADIELPGVSGDYSPDILPGVSVTGQIAQFNIIDGAIVLPATE